jgi:hypothetical protein
MGERMNKTYCRTCKYFRHWWFMRDFCDAMFDNLNTDDQCKYPDNIFYEEGYDKPKKRYREQPQYINKNNSCAWYERKFSVWRFLLALIQIIRKKEK